MDVGEAGALLAILVSALSAWLTYRAARNSTDESHSVSESDFTLRGLGQLNDSCMRRCQALEEREKVLMSRISALEDEADEAADREARLVLRVRVLEAEIAELRG